MFRLRIRRDLVVVCGVVVGIISLSVLVFVKGDSVETAERIRFISLKFPVGAKKSDVFDWLRDNDIPYNSYTQKNIDALINGVPIRWWPAKGTAGWSVAVAGEESVSSSSCFGHYESYAFFFDDKSGLMYENVQGCCPPGF